MRLNTHWGVLVFKLSHTTISNAVGRSSALMHGDRFVHRSLVRLNADGLISYLETCTAHRLRDTTNNLSSHASIFDTKAEAS